LEIATKQRIIGIVALLALGMIFIPILFSNEVPMDERINSRIELPPPPKLPTYQRHSKKQLTKPTVKIRDTVEIPEVWVVQLGVFKNKLNAAKLIQELRAKGFPAFTKLGKTGNEKATRVFIGPEIDRQKAKQIAMKLEKVFKIHGMVVRHKL